MLKSHFSYIRLLSVSSRCLCRALRGNRLCGSTDPISGTHLYTMVRRALKGSHSPTNAQDTRHSPYCRYPFDSAYRRLNRLRLPLGRRCAKQQGTHRYTQNAVCGNGDFQSPAEQLCRCCCRCLFQDAVFIIPCKGSHPATLRYKPEWFSRTQRKNGLAVGILLSTMLVKRFPDVSKIWLYVLIALPSYGKRKNFTRKKSCELKRVHSFFVVAGGR